MTFDPKLVLDPTPEISKKTQDRIHQYPVPEGYRLFGDTPVLHSDHAPWSGTRQDPDDLWFLPVYGSCWRSALDGRCLAIYCIRRGSPLYNAIWEDEQGREVIHDF